MALADTARLVASLELQDKFSKPLSAAEGSLAKAEATVGRTTGRFGPLSGAFNVAGVAAGKFGGALNHAKSQIGGLLSGPLGILGLTGGILSIGGAIESSLQKTSAFSLILERLTGLTGESAQSMGELALVAEKYGVDTDRLAQIVGFAEKTIGKLTDTTTKNAASSEKVTAAENNVTKAHERLIVARKRLNELEAKGTTSGSALAAARFRVTDATNALSLAEQKLTGLHTLAAIGTTKASDILKQYGVNLLDARGKAVNFTTELERVADFYNSNASAASKAQLAAQLFGRGFAVMIPILQLGSKGIERAKQAVDDMGLSLGTDTQGALAAYKQALRGLGEAVNVLQIQIGLALAPTITDLANNITLFLEHGGAKQITGFFREGAQFAKGLGRAIHDDVLPVFGAIKSGWDLVPDDFKKLIIGGAIVGKTSKFLFNFGPIDLAKSLGGGLFGQFLGRGSPANPMWVKDVTGGLGRGGLPVSPGVLGTNLLSKALLGAAGAIGIAIGHELLQAGVKQGFSAQGVALGAAGGAATIGGTAALLTVLGVSGPIAVGIGGLLAVGQTMLAEQGQNSQIAAGLQKTTNEYLAQQPSKDQLIKSLSAVEQGISDLRSNPLNVLVQGDALDKLTAMRADIQKQLDLRTGPDAGASDQQRKLIQAEAGASDQQRTAAGKLSGAADKLKVAAVAAHAEFVARAALYAREKGILGGRLRVQVEQKGGAKDALLVADAFAAKFEHSTAPWYQNTRNELRVLQSLEAAQKRFAAVGDTRTAAKLGTDIARLKADLHAATTHAGARTATATERAAAAIRAATALAGSRTAAAADRAAAAIRAKKLAFINNTTVNVSTVVSPAAIAHVTHTYNRYGVQVE